MIGTSHDTAEFAVDAIVQWWCREGRRRYGLASEVLILADSGGSNGARCRLWKCALQERLADRFGLAVTVCHYPTGASKWNPIEHRLFSEISKHWAGQPLINYPTIGSLAALGPLCIRLVRRADGEDIFNHLLKEYHYLGFSRPVGEHLKYLVFSGERPIACMAWNSGPLKLKLRDEFVGAPRQAYAHHLHRIAYNSRYLIAPWVKVPHLASHLLGRIARRISDDWQVLYHHPIHLLESFVDIERFKGTCYRAANWKCVGRSEGRGTKSKARAQTSIKELWEYPVSRDFRQKLLAP